MSIALLDVNFLVALFDPAHVSHDEAHRWFGRYRSQGWATCPITSNGCVRVLSSPSYPTVKASPAEVIHRLDAFCATPHHHFWPDSVSLTDRTLFQPTAIAGHRVITDVYLLGLAVRHHGRLVTFDRSIPLKAVRGASPAHLVVVAS